MTAPALNGIDHLHVFVQDRAATEAWHARVLGLRRVPAFEHWAADGGPLTLADAGDTAGLARWHAHVARETGVATQVADHAGSVSLYFSDTDGNRYEITTYEHDAARRALSSR